MPDLLKEVWIEQIIAGLYASTASINNSVNHSDFIENKIVHVPNAGAAAKILKNVRDLPISVTSREDIDLTYKINDFKISPMLVENIEEIELSYDKLASITAENKAKLAEWVAKDIFKSWVAGVKNPINGSTGTVKGWLKQIAKQFAKDKVPMQGRYVMMTEDLYYDFLETLSESESQAFHASQDLQKGRLGTYMGFTIVGEFLLPKKVKLFAWSALSVSRAIGSLKLYSREDDPTYYGSIVSGEMRAGGSVIRNDGKGVAAVDDDGVQDEAPKEKDENVGGDE